MNQRKAERQLAAATNAAARTLRQVYSLTDAFLRAEVLYEQFENEMETIHREDVTDDELMAYARQGIERVEVTPWFRVNALLSMHLAALYAVVEKWQEWKFRDPVVDQLLTDPRYEKLRKYRHAIFHADYFDAKDRVALASDLAIVSWTQQLASAIHDALLEWHSSTEARMGEHLLRIGW